jgi:hypothetical protein
MRPVWYDQHESFLVWSKEIKHFLMPPHLEQSRSQPELLLLFDPAPHETAAFLWELLYSVNLRHLFCNNTHHPSTQGFPSDCYVKSSTSSCEICTRGPTGKESSGRAVNMEFCNPSATPAATMAFCRQWVFFKRVSFSGSDFFLPFFRKVCGQGGTRW